MADEVLKVSEKKDSPEAKAARKAQAVGKVKLSKREEFTVIKDGNHLKKGDKISVCKPTEALLRELKYIK